MLYCKYSMPIITKNTPKEKNRILRRFIFDSFICIIIVVRLLRKTIFDIIKGITDVTLNFDKETFKKMS